MSRRLMSAVGVVAVMAAGAPAAAQAAARSQPQTITATGTGQARVTPANRHNNASIVAAVDRAHVAAISGALSQAREYGTDYAQAEGLTLGGVLSVSDAQQNDAYYGTGPGTFYGPFGPNQYCGTIEQVIGRPRRGHRVKLKKVHRCFVPSFAYTTLTVTYSAS